MNLQSIDCILTEGLSQDERKFLIAYLEWKGFRPEIQTKHSSSLRKSLFTPRIQNPQKVISIWHEANSMRIRDLAEEGWEVLVVGRTDLLKKKLYIRQGVGRFYEGILTELPLSFPLPNPNSLLFWIYTGEAWLDRIFGQFFASMGQRCILTLDANHLFETLPRMRPDLLILDWDSIFRKHPDFFQRLERYSQKNWLPLILGIKDYEKENVSTDLTRKISRFSRINLPRNKLFSSISYSFQSPASNELEVREVQRLRIQKPRRGSLHSIDWEYIKIPIKKNHPPEYRQTVRWFEWLQDPELWEEESTPKEF